MASVGTPTSTATTRPFHYYESLAAGQAAQHDMNTSHDLAAERLYYKHILSRSSRPVRVCHLPSPPPTPPSPPAPLDHGIGYAVSPEETRYRSIHGTALPHPAGDDRSVFGRPFDEMDDVPRLLPAWLPRWLDSLVRLLQSLFLLVVFVLVVLQMGVVLCPPLLTCCSCVSELVEVITEMVIEPMLSKLLAALPFRLVRCSQPTRGAHGSTECTRLHCEPRLNRAHASLLRSVLSAHLSTARTTQCTLTRLPRCVLAGVDAPRGDGPNRDERGRRAIRAATRPHTEPAAAALAASSQGR
jgi:hypothetical protein